MATGPLPIPPTPLIGHSVELGELEALVVQQPVRLVTVGGAAGVGKSRLVLQFAQRHADADHEVVFVPLAV